MTDYTNMEDGDFLYAVGDDANKWADAFVQRFPDCGIDQHTMMGWFANAIEHSQDVRTGRIHNGDHFQFLLDKAAEGRGVSERKEEP